MILVRTPLRISLFGGGSDIPSYYEKYTGTVLSTTIDKYMYIALCKTSYESIKVVYSDIEIANNVNDIKHSRVRECLKEFNIDKNIEISSFAEIPTVGTGLGSSSTFTVGLINGLAHLKNRSITKYELADLASEIEIQRCGEPIGKQDQYAAAFGGFNLINFHKQGTIVAKVNATTNTITRLNNNLLMFYTGIKRNTSDILKSVVDKSTDKDHNNRMRKMASQAVYGVEYLSQGDTDRVGRLLHEAWLLKREMSPGVTNEFIDKYYDRAMAAGALGGKILGAGGGGFLLFYVPPSYQANVRAALKDLKEFKFQFEDTGSTIAYAEDKFLPNKIYR